MGRITPDFSEDTSNEAIPTGNYPVRVMGITETTWKNGTPAIVAELAIFNAEGELAKYNNRSFRYQLPLKGPYMGKTAAFCKAAGVDIKGFDTEELMGKELLATCTEGKDKEGNPSKWPEVKRISKYTN